MPPLIRGKRPTFVRRTAVRSASLTCQGDRSVNVNDRVTKTTHFQALVSVLIKGART